MVVDSMAVTTSEIQSADGVQILESAVVQTLMNTGARIDHDCGIRPGFHIYPGTVLGDVKVRRGLMIRAGASLIPDTTIGENSVIGSGSFIVSDVLSSGRVVQKRITISS